MGIYTKDAIKEIAPNKTLQKCTKLFEEFNFESITHSHDIFEERHDTFGIYTGHFSINPYGLFQLFPEKFPYLEGKEAIDFQGSNGKGLSFDQCQASLYMEMFERVSIKLHEQKVKTQGEEVRKQFNAANYYSYLSQNAPYLTDHFKNKKFGFLLPEDEVDYIKVLDIADNSELYFPSGVLFDTMGTNGFTAGNTNEEAITGGIFEIVERYTQTLFCLDKIDAPKISLSSIISAFPELEDSVQKSSNYFDKYDVVDVSITINGVKFYSYFIRTEFDKTGHKTISSGGCHIDQRIALIRAVTEGIQAFEEKIDNAEKTITRSQGWGNFRMFSNYFIKRVYSKIDNLPEVPIEICKSTFSSIHEIYEKSIIAFEHVLVLDCTNENFKLPTSIIYIPELFSKTYIWPSLFHVGTIFFRDTIIAENVEGLERLFFWDIDLLDNKEENERKKVYLKTISKLGNKEINSFVQSLYPQYTNEASSAPIPIKEITAFDNDDPESFIYFDSRIKQKTEVDYLFESYARIGCLGLCKSFIAKLINQNLLTIYFEKYNDFGEYLLKNDEYEKALVIYQQLVEVSDNSLFHEKFEEIKLIIGTALRLKEKIFKNDKTEPSIFGISSGNSFENFTLNKVIEEGMFQFELQFENEGDKLNISIHVIEPDDYYAKSKNGIYIDHLHNSLMKKEKKLIKKLIKMINLY